MVAACRVRRWKPVAGRHGSEYNTNPNNIIGIDLINPGYGVPGESCSSPEKVLAAGVGPGPGCIALCGGSRGNPRPVLVACGAVVGPSFCRSRAPVHLHHHYIPP